MIPKKGRGKRKKDKQEPSDGTRRKSASKIQKSNQILFRAFGKLAEARWIVQKCIAAIGLGKKNCPVSGLIALITDR